MQYRPEIDGLRAVAVVPVILFHAGFGLFGGGYVGVDVFFVISGYLITSIILAELETGTFSIINFYERRARRILPALFFVMAACLPVAWLILLPRDMTDFAQSMVSVVTFSSNILFWLKSGYFDTASELKPLLHTWSLAVEEQYYIVFPLFLMLLWRAGRRVILGLMALLFLASLAAAEWGSVQAPSAAFYLLPMRSWELLTGAFAAFYLQSRSRAGGPEMLHQAGSGLGLGLIALAIFAYDHHTPFPGLFALAPVLGTALIIVFASPGTWVGALLGMRGFVGIGLISYSAYLWHQPLFAFTRYQMQSTPPAMLMLALAALTFPLAYFSWRFVERPFRSRHGFGRGQIFAFAGVLSAAFLGLGLSGHLAQGFPQRFSVPPQVQASFAQSPRQDDCFDKSGVHERPDWLCSLGESDQPPDFLVMGDSHALSLMEAFDTAADARGLAGEFTGTSGCVPFLGIHALRSDQAVKNCNLLNQRVLGHVKATPSIRTVFLVARWSYYTDGGYDGQDFSYIGLTPDGPRTQADSRSAFASGLAATAAAYHAAGINLVILPQVPEQTRDPVSIYYRAFDHADVVDSLKAQSVDRATHLGLQAWVNQAFAQTPHVTLLPLDAILCEPDTCPVGEPEASFYYDGDHLSLTGAKRVVPALAAALPES